MEKKEKPVGNPNYREEEVLNENVEATIKEWESDGWVYEGPADKIEGKMGLDAPIRKQRLRFRRKPVSES